MAALTVGELRVILGARINELETGLRDAQTKLSAFERKATASTDAASTGMRGLASTVSRVLVPLLGGLSAAAAIAETFQLAEAATNLRNRIRLVTDGADELEAVFGAIRKVANQTRVPIETTAELFNRLALSTQELDISQRDLVGITETINQTLAISGASATEAQAGLIQFAQGLASGALRGDELRSVLEQLPSLAREIAAGLGISVGQLRELGAQGALTAEAVLEALQKRAPQIREQFAQIAPTVSQAATVVRNELLVIVDAVNQTINATGGLATGLIDLGGDLSSTFGAGVVSSIAGLGQLGRALADLVDILENVGVTAGSVQEAFRFLLDSANAVISAIGTGFRSVQVGLAAIAASIQAIGNGLGVVSDAALAEGIQDFGEAQNALINSSERTNEALLEVVRGLVEVDSTAAQGPDTRFSDGLRTIAAGISESAERVKDSLADLGAAGRELSSETGGGAAAVKQLTAAQEKDLRSILELERRRNIERLKGVEPLEAERENLELQVNRLQRITGPQSVIEARDRVIASIREEQAKLIERQADAIEALPASIDEVRARLGELALLDPENARALGERVEQELSDAIGSEAQIEKLQEIGKEVSEAVIAAREANVGPSIGDAVNTAVDAGLREALVGNFQGALESFGASLRDTASESLLSAFKSATQGLSDLLDSVLPSSLEGFGGLFSGIVGGAIGAALTDTEVTSAAANVETAVTSAQQVRGVVAGPTEIGIAQVARGIEDAFREPTRLLRLIEENTRRVADRRSGASSNEAELALANEGPSFI